MPDDVHPQARAIIDRMAELKVPKVQDLSTRDARQMVEAMSAARRETYPPPDVLEVENTSTGPGYGHVPVRIYRTTDDADAPVIVFFHGGGHVFGSLDTHDTAARFLAQAANATVVSVDYRMGPEHPFPAAADDSFDATRWVADHAQALRVDAKRLAVCGDSAGGNLAAVVALMACDMPDFAISAQALIYPVIDYRGGTASHEKYAQGYGILEADTVTWFKERYLPDADLHADWRASPCNATSHAGLPPTQILTAECDVLHDDGAAYASQLEAAGVRVEYQNYPGMVHGFFGYLGLVDDAARAHQEVARFLKAIWS